MKKNLVLIALALFGVALVGCGGGEKKDAEPAPVEQGAGEGPKQGGGAASADMTPSISEAEANSHVGSKGTGK
ncbi:MAG: hypothetical protein JNJ45_11300 [Chthonomonas sp.]|nr:hypothetical protein [Chthonomonas sp.]